MSDALKQRAAELTRAAVLSHPKMKRVWGGRRDDCLGAAHRRVQEALPRFDPKEAELSTFIWPHVDGAIKDELRRQRAGMIGTGRGANYAPESLHALNATRWHGKGDISSPCWHAEPGIVERSSEHAEPKPPRSVCDSESPFAPVHGGADLVTAPGAEVDAMALTPHDRAAARIAEAGKASDRAEAPAAMRQMWREQARLDWQNALAQALASDFLSADDKKTVAELAAEPDAADAYALAVREVRSHYRDDDEAMADAAINHLLGVVGNLVPLRVEPVEIARIRSAQTSDAAHRITELWFTHTRTKKRQGPVRKFRSELHAFLICMPPELAAKLADVLPKVLAQHAKRFGASDKPAR